MKLKLVFGYPFHPNHPGFIEDCQSYEYRQCFSHHWFPVHAVLLFVLSENRFDTVAKGRIVIFLYIDQLFVLMVKEAFFNFFFIHLLCSFFKECSVFQHVLISFLMLSFGSIWATSVGSNTHAYWVCWNLSAYFGCFSFQKVSW